MEITLTKIEHQVYEDLKIRKKILFKEDPPLPVDRRMALGRLIKKGLVKIEYDNSQTPHVGCWVIVELNATPSN